MKKIIFTTLLLGIFFSCSIDNVETDLIPVSGQEVETNDVDCFVDINNPPAILGSTWARTSFIIETEIDGNGDGVFSNDLEIESTCSADLLTFGSNFQAGNPTFHNMTLEVIDDGSGNFLQNIGCLIGDGIFPFYSQDNNIISFCYSGELAFTATLSPDEQTLTFIFAFNDIFFPNDPNTILKQDGTVEILQGDVTLIYTRQ